MTRNAVLRNVDLAVVVLYTAIVNVLVLGVGLPPSTLRTALVLPLAVLLPGYALVSFLFPDRYGAGESAAGRRVSAWVDPNDDERGVPPLARVLLGVAASVILTPLVVLAENFVVGIYLRPALVGISALTVALCTWALAARLRLPTDQQFDAAALWPLGSRRSSLNTRRSNPGFRRTLTALLVVSMLLLASSIAFAAALPIAGISTAEDDEFTEFYLVTKNETGAFVMGNYPTQFAPGEAQPVFVTIQNERTETVEYTVVAQLQRVDRSGGGEQITSRSELARWQRIADPEGTVRIRHEISTDKRGNDLRVVYLLYRGGAPSNPTAANADDRLQLWISVSPGGGGGGGGASQSLAAPSDVREEVA